MRWHSRVPAVAWLAVVAIAIAASCVRAQVPQAAQQYRGLLVRAAHAGWGLDAPVAVFATREPGLAVVSGHAPLMKAMI